MAKEIIALTTQSNGTTITYQCAFWYPVATGKSAVAQNSIWTGASAAENTAIQNGSVIEEVNSYAFPIGTPIANIKAYLQQIWTNRNAQLNGAGPAAVFGVFFDSSTGWSA